MRFSDDNGGFFELNPFPGCNQVVVSNHSWIAPDKRGQGLGTKVHNERLSLMEKLGYDYALCTVKSGNFAQIAILNKAGWKQLDAFMNRETNNVVLIYGKGLNK